MRGRDTPRPLSRGEVGMLFFSLIMSNLVCMFPLWRGDKGGCVMVGCVGWFEVFFEVVFVGFVWLLLI